MRGKGEGSIFRRKSDGKWVGSLHLGYGNGRRQRRAFYGATQQEVRRKLAEATRNHEQGLRPLSEREKVGDFLTRWLNARTDLRPNTVRGYEAMLRVRIIPVIGHLKLARLRADDLDALYAQLLADGLSVKSVRLAHAILHRALHQALKWGLVAANVADIAEPPSAPRREFHTLTAEEAARLLAEARGDRYHALYTLAITTGLRQGELLGLRWSDLDLDGAVLSVAQQVYRLGGKWQYSAPKTKAGRRTVALPASAVEALRQHRLRQAEERLRVKNWQDLDLVFANEEGRPLERGNLVRRSFEPLLEAAGLPRIRFHDLRHACASLMLAGGVHPKVVQERLGHSSIAVTMDVYSHVMPGMDQAAAEKMDNILAASS